MAVLMFLFKMFKVFKKHWCLYENPTEKGETRYTKLTQTKEQDLLLKLFIFLVKEFKMTLLLEKWSPISRMTHFVTHLHH